MAKQYVPNVWTAGLPITSDKMNNIEDGIKYAADIADLVETSYKVDISTALNLANMAASDAATALTKANLQSSSIDHIKSLLLNAIEGQSKLYNNLLSLSQIFTTFSLQINEILSVITNNISTEIDALRNDLQLKNLILIIDNFIEDSITGPTTVVDSGRLRSIETRLASLDGLESGVIKEITDNITNILDVLNLYQNPVDQKYYSSAINDLIAKIGTDFSSENSISTAVENINDDIDKINDTLGNTFDRNNTVSSAFATLLSNLNDKVSTAAFATGLATKADASSLNSLAGIVSTNSTTIIVPKTSVTWKNDGTPLSLLNITPEEKNDYLILSSEDDKYYYWKYIGTSPNGVWHLISGASSSESDGGGTSSAEFYSSFSEITGDPSDKVDYFIGSGTNYIHYRYLDDQWVTILPTGLINSVTVDESNAVEGNNATKKSRPIIKALGSDTNLLSGFKAILSFSATAVNDGYQLTWSDIDGSIEAITISGGGGAATKASATIARITDTDVLTVNGETCEIEYKFTATDSNGDKLAASPTATWYINSVLVATSPVTISGPDQNITNIFNITPYLQIGTNNITVSININIDGQTFAPTKTWVVENKNFSLLWEYNESTINDGNTIEFVCTPFGTDIVKTLNIIIDETTITRTIPANVSGTPYTVIINNNLTHGVHHIEMYMTANINNISKNSNHVHHDLIVVTPNNDTPIIAATLPLTVMNQYDTITIPFVVYSPDSNNSTVILADNDTIIDTREGIDRTIQRWYYTPTTLGTNIQYEDEDPISGTHTLTLTCGSVVKTLTLTVNSVKINNNEIEGYAFKLKATELSSNNNLKAWHYDNENPTTTKLQFSNNFDWINGGLKTELDDNGAVHQYIRIKSGTRMTIPYLMFAFDPRETGSNFKIIFKVENCRDYDAQILDTVSEGIGILLNAHNASCKTTTTTVSTQYGEDEYTELEFEVCKATDNNNNPVPGQYILAWIDGVITAARVYAGIFLQSDGNRSSIVIGSDDCDVCIYLVKYYKRTLTFDEHIANFIADAPNASEMSRRFTRNDILNSEDLEIDYEKLMNNNPDCRVWLYDIEKMPTSKDKDFATKVYNFQQLWKNGDQYYQLVGENAKLTIQGTSSVTYRKGAANTDINFNVTGATLVDGYNNNLLDNNLEYKGFKINDDSLPITYANTKVNFASCEQVNNMCNAEWYQRYQPFPSLSARDCMEFAMGVQFIKDRGENEDGGEVRLFNEKPNRSDSKYYMYSIANMGTSKKNTHIFHDPNEVCVEVMANTSRGQRMLEWPTDLDWSGKVEGKDHSFELRYAEDENKDAAKTGWKRFIDWMASYNLSPYDAETNPNGYTNAALAEPVTFNPYTFRGHNREITQVQGRNFAQVLRGVTINLYAGEYTHDTFEYRMAKMLSECEDYMAMDSVVYHFCYIERHTMVDNVAKNTFWSSYKEIGGPNNQEGFWIWDLSKNYDNDTSDGNNNEGQLVFDYGNEATDTYGAKTVFNAADSVWFVFISHLYEACRAMFVNRESIGAWNAKNYHEYLLNEQRKVPERVWNACYWYDYLRTYENNINTSWITFLDGGQKTHLRKHYETYEELYDASKYMSPSSSFNTVNIRGYTPPQGTWAGVAPKTEFQIKMYNKCYLTIHVDDTYKQIKCAKGTNNIISFYNNNDSAQGYKAMNDAVITIDTPLMIQEIGDLSCLYPGSSSFTAATRLRVLNIGSSETDYINPNMTSTELLIFTNPMLEELNVQNLPYATYNLDLSKCPELKQINAEGSGFTGFEFANGGLLNEAYLNNPVSLIMRNLDYLTNANLHITTPTAITSLRLEGGKLFDNYTFINLLSNLNVLRLTDIDWSLNNNTLLNKLLGLMGMNESGFTVPLSYLAGNIRLTGTVHGGDYNEYMNAWSPDLIIDTSSSNFITEYLVTYYNEDGTALYRKYIEAASPFVDIVATGEYTTPSKIDDIASTYIFGRLEIGEYVPYSGWRNKDSSQSFYPTGAQGPTIPAVEGNMEVYAVYTAIPKQYVVRWLVDNTEVATVGSLNYGGGYNLSAPTIKDVLTGANAPATCFFTYEGEGLCSYRIMNGWDKLPTNIRPTSMVGPYDINATWLIRNHVDYNTVLTSDEYSVEEKLLVLKNIAQARNNMLTSDVFPIKLGYDGAKPGIELLSAPKRYSGIADSPIADYTPFAANKSFTIAIDYRFEQTVDSTNSKSEAVLMSCYEETGNSVQGFKLFYNPRATTPVPLISFGDTSNVTSSNTYVIGTSLNNRGMIVLRHIANENNLYVYSGMNNTGLVINYSSNLFRYVLQGTATPSDAKIVLGGSTYSNTGGSIMNASGTLYSVKYWEEDLGEGECMLLANWCHETMYLAIQDFRECLSHTLLNDATGPTLALHTLNASSMGAVEDALINRQNESTIGWDPSNVRTFYNERIYRAFPILLQSIMSPQSVRHVKGNRSDTGYSLSNNSTLTQDYVFAPSYREIGGALINNPSYNSNYDGEAFGIFPWSGLIIMTYSNRHFTESINTEYNYVNLRFPYLAININKKTRIFINYPIDESSFETFAFNESLNLTTGDTLVPAGDTDAYIYISNDDIRKGAPYVKVSSSHYLSTLNGGWIKSSSWWTRSIGNTGIQTNQQSRFTYITATGRAAAANSRTHGLVYSIML